MHILKKTMLAAAVSTVVGSPAFAQSFGFANFHAIVRATGSIARGSGVKAVTLQSVGRYVVQFGRSVGNCTLIATPWGSTGGQISVQGVASPAADMVTVFTFSRTGVPANLHFSVVANCS